MLRPKSIKLLEEKISKKLFDKALTVVFFLYVIKSISSKTKINKSAYIKQKIFHIAKKAINRITLWIMNNISVSGFISKI